MNKFTFGLLAISILFFDSNYYGSTTAPVVIAGGIIKSKHTTDVTVKYKRKDCPVCKGKGWYMSGDGIKRIECTYCEPEKGQNNTMTTPYVPSAKSDCPNGQCPIRKK